MRARRTENWFIFPASAGPKITQFSPQGMTMRACAVGIFHCEPVSKQLPRFAKYVTPRCRRRMPPNHPPITFGWHGTRVALRSDTNKVVLRSYRMLFHASGGTRYLQETCISTRKRGKNEYSQKCLHSYYGNDTFRGRICNTYATPVTRATVDEFYPGFSAFGVPPH